jgi:uncharacterized lipoprotein YmbA
MRQQKRPIAPKGDAFLHLFVTEKRIPRPLKTHHLVFQQAGAILLDNVDLAQAQNFQVDLTHALLALVIAPRQQLLSITHHF